MHKFAIKLALFGVVFILIQIASEQLYELCFISHGSIGFWCSLLYSFVLYVAILMSINLAWNQKPSTSVYAGLIPVPMAIYTLLDLRLTGRHSLRYPEVIDLLNHYFASYSVPCIIAAIAISYARNRD